jgi:hypothetical protein
MITHAAAALHDRETAGMRENGRKLDERIGQIAENDAQRGCALDEGIDKLVSDVGELIRGRKVRNSLGRVPRRIGFRVSGESDWQSSSRVRKPGVTPSTPMKNPPRPGRSIVVALEMRASRPQAS